MKIEGILYPAGTSRAVPATLEVDLQGMATLVGSYADITTPVCHANELNISPRIGNSKRQLRFHDGGLFETTDNDAVDQIASAFKTHHFQRAIHYLESRARNVALSAVTVIVLVGLFMVYAVPMGARHIAMSLPPSMAVSVGEGSLKLLDQMVFEPSRLSHQRQNELRDKMASVSANAQNDHVFTLKFRHSQKVGANAFALPNGTLIVTDDLVELASNDQQIMAVLIHEMGHVVYRHALQQVLQNSSLSIMLILVTGDIISATNLAAAIPGLLLKTHYSRSMETEADNYARDYMLKNGLAPVHFTDIMHRLAQSHEENLGEDDEFSDILSSHPAIEDRIEQFLKKDP